MSDTAIFYIAIAVACFAVLTAQALLYGRMLSIERKLGGPVTPFWEAAIKILTARLTHPHAEAAELDKLMKELPDLMKEAAMMPATPMEPDRYARLIELLEERSESKAEWLRPEERQAAKAFLELLPIVILESTNLSQLTDVQIVSSRPVEDQTASDRNAQKEIK